MKLHLVDVTIVVGYLALVVAIGLWVSRRGVRDLDGYFLGGRRLPWYLLGVSDASGMFDISGTMYLVYALFVYGLKSLWLPWLWPVFNQIFLMMFLSAWLRRSNVMTGAAWIATRFGRGTGANLAHLSVVFFALVNVVGMLAYAFKGIGKFAAGMLPWHFDAVRRLLTDGRSASAMTPLAALASDENLYAAVILALTCLYVVKGGMVSVVITEVTQFLILTVTSITIGLLAMFTVSRDQIARAVPEGWAHPFFGWRLHLDWRAILPQAGEAIRQDGNELFTIVFGLMLGKGVLASLAGPAPNYDMQRILATRSPREASLMNGMVNVVLYFPRYMMITGITVLALVFYMPALCQMPRPDFETILPIVLGRYVPVGVLGFLLAGLLAAFMSNFAATVNAAPAYVVNDIYKRFINPHASGKTEVRLGRLVSLAALAVGVLFGLVTTRITDVMMWIVSGLYGGYVMANVLKWYWWRFNGYGYFWGLMAGLGSALATPAVAGRVLGHPIANPLFLFPVVFGISAVGCLLGTWLTPPEEAEVLDRFYETVNPWGLWGPVRQRVVRHNPAFRPNPDFRRDMLNVAVGIVWQLCLPALPIFLVLRLWPWVAATVVVLAATTMFIKRRWYDRLEPAPPAPAPQPR